MRQCIPSRANTGTRQRPSDVNVITVNRMLRFSGFDVLRTAFDGFTDSLRIAVAVNLG